MLEKDINNDISDKSFKEKKPFYSNSKYKEARVISEINEWNKSQIDKHQSKMAKIAESIWSFI